MIEWIGYKASSNLLFLLNLQGCYIHVKSKNDNTLRLLEEVCGLFAKSDLFLSPFIFRMLRI